MRTMRGAARLFFKNSHFTQRRFFTQSTIWRSLGHHGVQSISAVRF